MSVAFARAVVVVVAVGLCGGAPSVMAQTGVVAGTVHDDTGRPLPGVNVYLEGTTLGSATTATGQFRIEAVPSGSYEVVASAVGYASVRRALTVEAGTTYTLRFALREQALLSDEVVVTAARRAQRFSEVPVSIFVLRPEDLDVRNVVSLDDALRNVPGLQMAENQVNIRGSSGFSFNTGSRVLLLLDGMPLLTPDRDGIPFESLPLAQIEQVEVLKGPGSALYGGGALGGVINVITRDFPDQPETRLRLFGGAYEPVRYAEWRDAWSKGSDPRPYGGGAFTHARRLGQRAGAWLNVAYRRDDGYLNFGAERDLDAYLKVGWRPGPVRLNVLAGWTRRRSDTFLYWNGARDVLNPGELNFGGARATGTNDNLTQLVSLLPAVTHVVGPRFFYSLKGRLFGAVIQPLEDDGTPKPVSDGTLGFRFGGEAQVNWVPRADLFVTAGAMREGLITESSFFKNDAGETEARSQPETALFGQVEHTLFGRLAVVAGLRYDLYEIDAGNVERELSPKVNLSTPLFAGTTLRLAYGRGFRVPSMAERFVNDQAFLPIVKNLDLRPEVSTSYEAGLRSLADIGSRASVQLDGAVFWNTYEGLVEPKFIPEEQAFQFVNLTEARIRGLEITGQAATADDAWRISMGYTLLDADDLTDETALVFRSRHLLKAALAGHIVGPLFFGLDLRYASAPERVDSDFSRFVLDADLVGARRVVDARLGAAWDHVRVTLMADNAFDYYYVERPAILAPPRHYTIQLQIDL